MAVTAARRKKGCRTESGLSACFTLPSDSGRQRQPLAHLPAQAAAGRGGLQRHLQRRDDDGSYVDVEMPRSEFAALRQRLGLRSGSRVHLRARRITRFSADSGAQHELPDPAAMI